MKRLLSVLLICFYTFTALAQKDFEGEIVYATKVQDKNIQFTIVFGHSKAATITSINESPGNAAATGFKIIYDFENSVSYIIIEADMTVLADSISMKTGKMKKIPLLKKTGNTKNIAGYNCYQMVDSSSSENYNTGTIWVSEEFKLKTTKYKTDAGYLDFFLNEGLVLEATSADKNDPTAQFVKFTAISVTPKSIPADFFEIPPGYKTVSLTRMHDDLVKAGRSVPPPPLKKGEKIRAKSKSKRKQ
jgi:hypothetical protein